MGDLLASLDQDFVEFLKTEHNQSVAKWKLELSKHAQCGTWKAERLNTGDVSAALGNLNAARTTHKLCRQSEFIWNQYVVSKGVVSTAKLHKVTEQDEALCGLMEQVTAKANAYGASNVASKESCQVDQEQFEANACLWYQAKTAACQAHDTCVLAINLADTRKTLLDQAESRQNLMITIGKLKCRLTHMLETFKIGSPSNFTATDNCDGQKTSVDALVVSLEVPFDGDNAACSADADLSTLPGDVGSVECNNWLAQYGEWTDAVKPKSCLMTCQKPATGPVVKQGCVDGDAAQCFFYNHHFDLCGKFDVRDGFKAADTCCSCGKAAPGSAMAPSLCSNTHDGYTHHCAIRASDKKVMCWGHPHGTAASQGSLSVPSDLGPVRSVAVCYTSCALQENGEVRCWGYKKGGTTDVPDDLGKVRQIVAARTSVCAVREDMTVKCWGHGSAREWPFADLGTVGKVRAITALYENYCAVRAADGLITCWDSKGKSMPPPGGADVLNQLDGAEVLDVGGSHYLCVVLAPDRTLKCLGHGPQPPQDLGPVRSLDAFSTGYCAVQASDGLLRCWGQNLIAAVPSDLGPVDSVRVGNDYACAVRSADKRLRCWGNPNPHPGVFMNPLSTDVPSGLGEVADTSCSV